jgi:hyperosmotically inducible periplasmic protein
MGGAQFALYNICTDQATEIETMNSQSTSRIVIGLGMAVVVGVGASIFAVRAKNESVAVHKPIAPAPIAQPAPDQLAANQLAANQTSSESAAADQSAATPAAPPSVAQNPATPAPSNGGKSGAKGNSSAMTDPINTAADKPKTSDKRAAKSRVSDEPSNTRVASANAPPPVISGESANLQTAANAQEADPQQAMTNATPSASTEPVTSDNQITTQVKSQIAAAGTHSDLDVKTTDGVVAIAGSAPSQDAVDQVKQAAERVAGVKHVDTSTLTVASP